MNESLVTISDGITIHTKYTYIQQKIPISEVIEFQT